MRLLFVVQAYGSDVYGGAETACRQYATGMAGRGHDVEVVTSCARNYVDWADVYPPGRSEVDGVTVNRLSVGAKRELELFAPLNGRAVYGRRPVPLYLQREWMQLQGPRVDALPGWLRQHAPRFDAVAFFTYLYWTTWAGLPAAAGRVPTVLHPLAHDEAPFSLPLFDTSARLADGVAFLTPEEQQLFTTRFGARPSAVTGLGIDLDPPRGDIGDFRRRAGLGERPFLIAVGRVDSAKGVPELWNFFAAYKQRHPGDLALAIAGEQVESLPDHPDVVQLGPISELDKQAALAGAVAMVQPSYFESFSIVLMEAWAGRTPALVQGHSDVLLGHARRSGGAIPYFDYAGFDAALELLLADAPLRGSLADAGRAYVERHCRWDGVFGRYERLLQYVRSRRVVEPV